MVYREMLRSMSTPMALPTAASAQPWPSIKPSQLTLSMLSNALRQNIRSNALCAYIYISEDDVQS